MNPCLSLVFSVEIHEALHLNCFPNRSSNHRTSFFSKPIEKIEPRLCSNTNIHIPLTLPSNLTSKVFLSTLHNLLVLFPIWYKMLFFRWFFTFLIPTELLPQMTVSSICSMGITILDFLLGTNIE